MFIVAISGPIPILELNPRLFDVSGLMTSIDFQYLLALELEILTPVFTDAKVKNINPGIC
jgi:hypothetical protein